MKEHIIAGCVEKCLNDMRLRFERRNLQDRDVFKLSFDNCGIPFQHYRSLISIDPLFFKIFFFYEMNSGDRRIEVMDLINRINFRLHFGRFEMDANDGETRYFFSQLMDVVDEEKFQMFFVRIFNTAFSVTKDFATPFFNVASGKMSAEIAFRTFMETTTGKC